MARLLIAVAAGLLIAIQIVRNAAVTELAAQSPDTAAHIWRDHPALERHKHVERRSKFQRWRPCVEGVQLRHNDS